MLKIYFIILLVNITLTGFYPLIPLHVEKLTSSHASIWSGLIIGVPFFCSAVMGPIWGRIALIKGYKTVFLIQSLAIAISFLLQGLSESPLTLFLSRSLGNIFAGLIASLFGYVSLLSQEDKIGRALTNASIASSLGFVIGPGLTGLLISKASFQQAFFTASMIMLLIFFIILTMTFKDFKDSHGDFKFFKKLLGDIHRTSVKKAYFLVFLLFVVITIPVPLESIILKDYLDTDYVALRLGQLITIGSIIGLFVSFIIGGLIDKGFHRPVFLACLSVSSLSFLIIGVSKNIVLISVAIIGRVVSQCEYNSLSNIMVIRKTTDSLRGQAVISTFSIVKIGIFLGASLSGFLSTYIGTYQTILLSGFLLLFYLAFISKELNSRD